MSKDDDGQKQFLNGTELHPGRFSPSLQGTYWRCCFAGLLVGARTQSVRVLNLNESHKYINSPHYSAAVCSASCNHFSSSFVSVCQFVSCSTQHSLTYTHTLHSRDTRRPIAFLLSQRELLMQGWQSVICSNCMLQKNIFSAVVIAAICAVVLPK